MSKAVLVMDMPEDCLHCKYLNSDTGECYATGAEKTMFTEWVEEDKPDWCPLHPMPENLIPDPEEKGKGWVDGWNACIDAITGESKVN